MFDVVIYDDFRDQTKETSEHILLERCFKEGKEVHQTFRVP